MGIPVVKPPLADPGSQTQRDTRTAIKALDAAGVRKITVHSIALGTTTVAVAHQLGKKPVGWQIIDKNAQADVWRDSTQTTTNDTIPLKASATVTVDIQFW